MSRRCALALLFCLVPLAAHAHQPSDTYLRLDATEATITGQWDVALRDLDVLIAVDENGDRNITWGELSIKRSAIEHYLRPHLTIYAGGRTCSPVFNDLLVDRHAGIGFAVLRFVTDCPGLVPATVRYTLLFDLDPLHRGLLRLRYPGSTVTAVFAPDSREQHFRPDTLKRWSAFLDYMRTGAIHIWNGFDHLLFLLCLLLPAVLRRDGGRWRPVTAFRPALWSTVSIVTAFTVAHSITLLLASLELVSLPTHLVEAAIAASIVVAALNNLVPVVRQHAWSVAFSFGLLHGFGFANVMRGLDLDGGPFAMSLLGFNLGVELGQLCIVAVWLPLSFALRNFSAYRYLGLYAGSASIAAIAAVWVAQRLTAGSA